jgi:hypothetical protein
MAHRRHRRFPRVNGTGAVVQALALLTALLIASPVLGDEETALRGLLTEFLQHVDEVEMHERFWDDALIYTSSSGARFGKADILQGMTGQQDGGDAAAVRYWAEDVRVMVFDDTAVVAFRLMSETVAGDAVERASYHNTGTFRLGDDGWRVVAWQATRIPDEA